MSTGNWKNHKYLYTKKVTTKDGKEYVRYFYEVTGKGGKKSRTSYTNTLSENLTPEEQRLEDMNNKALDEGGDQKRGLSNWDLMMIEEAHEDLKSGHLADNLMSKLKSGDYKAFAQTGKYYAETFGKELVGNIKGGLSDAKNFVSGFFS